jgi:hypothetical protein
MSLQAPDFSIPALVDADCTTAGIAAAINLTLGLPGSGSAVLPLVAGEVPPPPPTTTTTAAPPTTTTAAPTAAQPAAVTAATPSFTG